MTETGEPGSESSTVVDFKTFSAFCAAREISAEDCKNLYDTFSVTDIGILVDDSPSMNNRIVPSWGYGQKLAEQSPVELAHLRWGTHAVLLTFLKVRRFESICVKCSTFSY